MITNKAVGVATAVAGVSAPAIDAGFLVSALGIRCTSTDERDWYLSANSVRICYPAVWTSANHCSNRNSVQDSAPGIFEARSDDMTRIYAGFFDASELAGTVDVLATLWLLNAYWWTSFTVGERITDWETLGTSARWCVRSDEADGVGSARRTIDARIYAAFVLADEVLRTLVVAGALSALTKHFWVSEVTWTATASTAVVLSVAFRIDDTLILQKTRVHASSSVACFFVRTVFVCFALQFGASQLRIARVPWMTDA